MNAKQQIKICGLKTAQTTQVALDSGADMIGLVSFEQSPRHISWEQGKELATVIGVRAQSVALSVDGDDQLMDHIMTYWAPDYLQLHGHETIERVQILKQRYGVKIIKAIGIADKDDLDQIDHYRRDVDYILLDAKPPRQATRPGGLGQSFDWSLLHDYRNDHQLILSGGLNPDNVGTAIIKTGLSHVDVSSGVEVKSGVKDTIMIKEFIGSARRAHQSLDRQQ